VCALCLLPVVSIILLNALNYLLGYALGYVPLLLWLVPTYPIVWLVPDRSALGVVGGLLVFLSPLVLWPLLGALAAGLIDLVRLREYR
jgi:hypothetical protein